MGLKVTRIYVLFTKLMQVVLAGGSVNYKMALAVGACHLLHKD